MFDRKNYFYPDLPQGYQITQYKQPIVGEGEVEIDVDGETRQGRHRAPAPGAGRRQVDPRPAPGISYVDLNRSGVALMEIVSKPDMRSAKQAQAYVTKLRTILRYLGTSDGDMEKGNLRADVNVSVRRPGDKLGTRCEIKNVNSIRFIGQAIEVEARRQIDIIEDGGKIEQETRLFDPARARRAPCAPRRRRTTTAISPIPDLLPLELTQAYVDGAEEGPAGAAGREARALHDASTGSRPTTRTCWSPSARSPTTSRRCAGAKGDATRKQAANWVINELFGRLNKEGKASISQSPVSADAARRDRRPDRHGHDLRQDRQGRVRDRLGEGGDPAEIVEKRGLKQVTDTGAIEKAVDEIIAANPDKVAQVKAKPAMLGWFVGQVMKATGGKANPQAVNELLKKKLGL